MKRLALPLLFAISVLSGQKTPLFDIDVRIRVVDDDLLYVVVQVDNHSGRMVTELAGYITEATVDSDIVSEKRIVHVHPYDPMFTDGQTVVRGFTYPFEEAMSHRFRYHISRVTFRNDARVFAWSPTDGLIRVE